MLHTLEVASNGDRLASIIKGIKPEQLIVMLSGSDEMTKATEEILDCVDHHLSKPISLGEI